MNHKHRYLMVLLLVTAVFSACKKQWDERTTANQELDKNLMQKIQENSNLSTFAGYLTKIGYDKVLASSKTYTVWAPDNQALQNMDPAVVADTARLRLFVANHIANQVFLTTTLQPSQRVGTLNGKRVSFTPTTVEDASLTVANQYVSNGVLHIINKPLTPKMNIWEYVKSLTAVGGLQKAYLLRQDTSFVDTSKATVDRIDPVTGKPILVPNTGVVNQNKYLNRVANLASEDSLYTYFVLTDDAYNAERSKVSRFFTTVSGSTDTTMNILAAYNVLKDVAVRGLYQQANLPAELISVKGVKVPVNKAAIVQSYQASNGMVYVMNSMNFSLSDKIPPIIVQGEKPSFFQTTNRRSNIQYRTKKDPNGVPFSDVLLSGTDLPANYYVVYKLSNMYTCQYDITWRAINDIAYTANSSGVFPTVRQQLRFGASTLSAPDTYTPAVNFPLMPTYSPTHPVNYGEEAVTGATTQSGVVNPNLSASGGKLNVLKYSSVHMYLQNENINGTGSNVNLNAMTLDYVILRPIL